MKILKIFIIACFFFLISIFLHQSAFAQIATQSSQTNITVTVAGSSLSVDGFIAPFASIVLTINGAIITSTTANAQGNFSFFNISVPKATSTVCFDAVDFKKLGSSQACINVTPINGVISQDNVFLPPTLGVQRTNVSVGSNAIAFGYGMPGSTITVHINGLTGCSTSADSTGYYTCSILIQKAQQYSLFSDSVLNGKPSEQQLYKVLIQGIAFIKPTLNTQPTPVQQLPTLNLFQIPWWVWLLLVLIAIILIIILLRRYIPGLTPSIAAPGIGFGLPSVRLNNVFDFLFKERKLHHHWMKGIGY